MCHGRDKVCPGCRVAAMPREARQLRDWKYQRKAWGRKYAYLIRKERNPLMLPAVKGFYYRDMKNYYDRLIKEQLNGSCDSSDC